MTGDPTKLTVVGATDLERELLEAASSEAPSPELTRRMRLALGLAPIAPPLPTPPATSAAAPVAAAKVGMAGLVAATLVAAAVTGVAVVRLRAAAPAPRSAAPVVVLPPAPQPPVAEPALPAEPEAAPTLAPRPSLDRTVRPHHHVVVPPPAHPDIRTEIALVDAARTAVKSGDPERALALLHSYDARFPAGAFHPEVAALRIESLAADGQTDLARTRARDFIAAHPESPLSTRLTRIASAR